MPSLWAPCLPPISRGPPSLPADRPGRCAPHIGQPQLDGPDLAEVFHSRIPVQRHVPRAARSAWAQCLARALAAAAAQNTLTAWRDLLMLPKAILRSPRRGGSKRREEAAQQTLRRCRRWLEGERGELWEACPARPRSRNPVNGEAANSARQSRCLSLAGEGELSRACAALLSPPLLAEDGGVLDQLRAKHPSCPPARPGLVPLGPPAHNQVPDLSIQQVLTATRGFRRGSAAGPTGLRGDHLREALSTPHCDEVGPPH